MTPYFDALVKENKVDNVFGTAPLHRITATFLAPCSLLKGNPYRQVCSSAQQAVQLRIVVVKI